MTNYLRQVVVFALLLFSPAWCVGQYLDLGPLSAFEAYTGNGAVTNSGTFTGDVGTYAGALTGFVPPDFTGNVHNHDAVTTQARADLLKIYIQLSNLFVTQPGTHAAAFGGGETIAPGVYAAAGAGSLAGNLTLDGGGDANAVFILKFAGAFSAGAGSTVVLTNGTRACNVFWIAQGAISLATGSAVMGSLLSYPGAISLAANCTLEGRMLTASGAITVGAGGVVRVPAGPITIPGQFSADRAPAPAVDVLGSVANFTLFTSAGAVTNSATSGIIGDIGTQAGAVSGFADSEQIGSVYAADAVTAQAVLDLDSAYARLLRLPNTALAHAPAFGLGETLPAGVYFINGAGSLAGTITLDGQNNPDAVFVFKFGGAFSVATQSKVIFANGVRRCNVFWLSGAGVAAGAVSIGANSHLKGTFLAHGGACTSGAGSNMEGRLLSTGGAIGFSTGVVYTSPRYVTAPAPLPVALTAFTATATGPAAVRLAWATASEKNSARFEVERSTDGRTFAPIGAVAAAGSSSALHRYEWLDRQLPPGAPRRYYRLKQVDTDGTFAYSPVRVVALAGAAAGLSLYPNPAHGGAATLTGATPGTVVSVFDALGRWVTSVPADAMGTAALALPAGLPTGVYVVRAGRTARRLAVE
jgi:hypothetical protein